MGLRHFLNIQWHIYIHKQTEKSTIGISQASSQTTSTNFLSKFKWYRDQYWNKWSSKKEPRTIYICKKRGNIYTIAFIQDARVVLLVLNLQLYLEQTSTNQDLQFSLVTEQGEYKSPGPWSETKPAFQHYWGYPLLRYGCNLQGSEAFQLDSSAKIHYIGTACLTVQAQNQEERSCTVDKNLHQICCSGLALEWDYLADQAYHSS